MRVLWGASSQPGSLFPAVPIVLELLRRGHQVTALSDAASAATFLGLGCDVLPENSVEALSPPARPLTPAAKAVWFRAYTAALYADASRALARSAFDVVLCDPLETGVDFAAEAAGVPYCSYVHWGLDETGPDVPFSFHLWDGRTPVDTAFASWWNVLRADAGLPEEPRPASQHRWHRTSPQLTLLLGLPDLVHPHGTLPPRTSRVGPTVWHPPPTAPTPEWVDALGRERPAVLATVSTIASSHDLDVLTQLSSAAESLDLELVVTVPTAHELPPLPGRARIAPFLPHDLLLERASVFVNHAGNGSVNRAALAGKPVLLMPTGRDQFQVARGATAAGFAIELEQDDRSDTTIRHALERLVHDPSFTDAARRLARRARSYDAPRTSADLVESLV